MLTLATVWSMIWEAQSKRLWASKESSILAQLGDGEGTTKGRRP